MARPAASLTRSATVAGFLPIDRRAALHSSSVLPDRSTGAVLFADLTGFTRVAETLAAELGPRRGAEELSRHLSRVYETLIARVHEAGGSVVAFHGDALLCWFGDRASPSGSVGGERSTNGNEDAPVAMASLRAVATALRMQEAMPALAEVRTARGTTLAFGLKVGIAAGPVRRFLVGDSSRRLFDVLAGGTVDRAVAAQSRASPGEILVSHEAMDGLPVGVREWRTEPTDAGARHAVLAELRTTIPFTPWSPDSGRIHEADVRAWLPPSVFEHARHGSAFQGEFRSVLPLFVHFEGIEYDADDAAGDQLGQYVGRALDIIEHYGGTLLQIVTGDKGSHALVAFGAPTANDDDAERAGAAALELAAMAPVPHAVSATRVGMSSGRAYAGIYGSPDRCCYSVLGDAVNLAARAMELAAPGSIVTTQPAPAGSSYRTEPIGTRTLKGRTGNVALYELRGGAGTRGRGRAHDGPIVGRDGELRLLEAALDTARHDTRIALIEGEAGIGKSRLVQALLERGKGFRILLGAADPMERRRAYHAWTGVLRGALHIAKDADAASGQEAVVAQLDSIDPDLTRRAPLLAGPLGIAMPDNSLTAQMTGEVRATNTRALFIRILTHVAREQPLIVALEDAHWFDSASWSLLRDVCRAVEPALILCTTRPMDDRIAGAVQEFRKLADDPRTLRISLDALAPEHAVVLAARRLGVERLPAAVARLLQHRAEGHPLFTQELALAMVDAGHLVVRDGACAIADAAERPAFEYPHTVEGVVASRVDRLSPEEQLTAKVASVIGRSFAIRALLDVHPSRPDEAALRGWLEVLTRRGIALPESPGSDASFAFNHAITHQVIYDRLLFAQRQQLHRSVAHWYEEHRQDDLATHYPLLARHWEEAGDPARMLHYLERAGEQAAAGFANDEAIALLSKAQRAVQSSPDLLPGQSAERRLRLARWSRLIADARVGIGEVDAGYRDMQDALRLLGRPEPGPRGMALGFVYHFMIQASHRLFGRSLLERRGDSRSAIESAWVYHSLVHPYFMRGNWLGGLYSNWYMANVAERYRHDTRSAGLLPRALANLGGAWLNIVHVRRVGDWYIETARGHARQSGDLQALGWTYLVEGMVRFFNSRLDEAGTALAQAQRFFADLGDARHWEETTYVLATTAFFRGDFASSARIACAQLESARRRDDVESQLLALNHAALLEVLRANLASALELLAEADALAQGRANLPERVFSGGVRALAHARAGEAAAAAAAIARTAPLIDQVGIANLAIEGFSAIADAVVTLEEQSIPTDAATRRTALRAVKLLSRNAAALSRIHRARARLLEGSLAVLTGRSAHALRQWRRAMTLSQQAHIPYDEARAGLEIARRLPPGDPERGALLDHAAASFRRIGTPWELELSERAQQAG